MSKKPKPADVMADKPKTLADALRVVQAAKKPVCKVCDLKELAEVHEAKANGARYSEIGQALRAIGIQVSDDKVSDHFREGHDKQAR